MRTDRFELPLRIVMDDPVPDVAFALQHGGPGKEELRGAVRSRRDPLSFEFDVTVHGAIPDGRPRFLGPFVHGPPPGRFVYLRVGTAAGDPASPWSRRVKILLKDLGWAEIGALKPGQRLEAHYAGTGRDGSPSCATVPLKPPAWRSA
jgi:hypothetical protein